MNGSEMLIGAVFKALNLDPEKVKGDFAAKAKGFEDNFNLLCANMVQINQRLSNIENHLGISNANDPARIGNGMEQDNSSRAGIGENL